MRKRLVSMRGSSMEVPSTEKVKCGLFFTVVASKLYGVTATIIIVIFVS